MSLDRRLREEFGRRGAQAPTEIPPETLSRVLEKAGLVRRRQRRERALAAMAVAAVLVGVVGLRLADIGGIDAGPRPVVNSPSPSPSESALVQTYTSAEHHFQISYPDGWTVKAATKPWKYGNWTTFRTGHHRRAARPRRFRLERHLAGDPGEAEQPTVAAPVHRAKSRIAQRLLPPLHRLPTRCRRRSPRWSPRRNQFMQLHRSCRNRRQPRLSNHRQPRPRFRIRCGLQPRLVQPDAGDDPVHGRRVKVCALAGL